MDSGDRELPVDEANSVPVILDDLFQRPQDLLAVGTLKVRELDDSDRRIGRSLGREPVSGNLQADGIEPTGLESDGPTGAIHYQYDIRDVLGESGSRRGTGH